MYHGDLRPKHITLASHGPQVASFGLLEALTPHARRSGTDSTVLTFAAPAYASPEQLAEDAAADARSDIYSLGCVLFEMLAGEPPFGRSGQAGILHRKLTQPAPSVRSRRESASEELDLIVRTCLARVPADRFRTVAEVGTGLERLLMPGR